MAKYVESDLYDLGYEEVDVDSYLFDFKQSNSFDVLPENVRSLYKMKPCVYKYELTDEVKQECINYIDSTIDMWEKLDQTNELDFPPRSFEKLNSKGEKKPDYFFCTSLCGHFKNCPHINDYLDQLTTSKEDDDDLF